MIVVTNINDGGESAVVVIEEYIVVADNNVNYDVKVRWQ